MVKSNLFHVGGLDDMLLVPVGDGFAPSEYIPGKSDTLGLETRRAVSVPVVSAWARAIDSIGFVTAIRISAEF